MTYIGGCLTPLTAHVGGFHRLYQYSRVALMCYSNCHVYHAVGLFAKYHPTG